jgi:hypothetical protein
MGILPDSLDIFRRPAVESASCHLRNDAGRVFGPECRDSLPTTITTMATNPANFRFRDAFAAARRLFQVRAPTARRIKR